LILFLHLAPWKIHSPYSSPCDIQKLHIRSCHIPA
jgi:hypothetical protein